MFESMLRVSCLQCKIEGAPVSKPFGLFSLVTTLIVLSLITVVLLGHDSGRRDALFNSVLIAADSSNAIEINYVGSKKCRICHLDVYKSWLTTKHASATSLLTGAEQDSMECMACHATGSLDNAQVITDVGCEACHGAGSEYRKMRIMKNRELAIQHGLTVPAAAVCVKCHNDRCEHAGYLDIESIDFKTVHTIPSTQSKY